MSASPTAQPDFFTVNNGLWSFGSTIATLIMTGFTLWVIIESIKTRKALFQPNIIVDINLTYYFELQLVIINTGNSPARNIRIDIEPQIHHPFSNITFLAPNKELKHNFSSTEKIKSSATKKFEIAISYNDIYGKLNTGSYSIDLEPILSSYTDSDIENPLMAISHEMKNIAHAIDRIH